MTDSDKKRIEAVRERVAENRDFGAEGFLLKKLEEAYDILRCVRDGYDHDPDAHRYNTMCRCCEAEKILGVRD